MKTRIAIDIDEVLADTMTALRLLVNKRFGLSLSDADYRIPGDFNGYFTYVWECNKVGDFVRFEDIRREMAVDQSHVKPMRGAKNALNKLSKNYDIVLVTSRFEDWEGATKIWLKNTFGNLHSEIYFVHHDRRDQLPTKGEVCRQIGAQWLIDDNPAYCRSATELGVETILFGDYGWQTGDLSLYTRCRDWTAVLEHFDNV